MGFFKRFLSLGSRRSKKNKQKEKDVPPLPTQVDAEGRIVRGDDRHADLEANRLLRSASARFSVAVDTDYTSLPPLPHSVSNLPATLSTPSVRSSNGLQRSNTYVVKVLERTVHSRTEFPNANPALTPPNHHEPIMPRTDDEKDRPHLKEVVFTPRDQNRLHTLRRDPSVASLLNMYDDQGCLDAKAFSNTPPSAAPTEGRAQVKRSGSTLRQLLGDTEARRDATEGDISWADRFLQEAGSASSSSSSLLLETPSDADALFPKTHDLSKPHVYTNMSLEDSNDFSMSLPGFSSLVVECSELDEKTIEEEFAVGPAPSVVAAVDPKTPQRASEVFGFLTERRKSLRMERTLTDVPSTVDALEKLDLAPVARMPTPIGAGTATLNPISISIMDESQCPLNISHAQVETATLMKLSTTPAMISENPFSSPAIPVHRALSSQRAESDETSHRPAQAAPTRRATFDRSSLHQDTQPLTSTNTGSSQGPRGPRPQRGRYTLSNPSQTDLPADLRTIVSQSRQSRPPQPMPVPTYGAHNPRVPHQTKSHSYTKPLEQDRLPSGSCRPSAEHELERRSHTSAPPSRMLKSTWDEDDKENSADHSPNSSPKAVRSKDKGKNKGSRVDNMVTAPSTPLRSRSIFDQRYPNGTGNLDDGPGVVPSPASSSELSPVAREMMMNLRKQRMKARQTEKRYGRSTRAVS